MLDLTGSGRKMNQNDYNSVRHNLKTNENNDRGMRTQGYIYISTRMTKQENNEQTNKPTNAEGDG